MLDPSLPLPTAGRTFSRPAPRATRGTWTSAGGCGSTRSRDTSRTSRSTTCRRPGGERPSTSGSCDGSGSRYDPFTEDREVRLVTRGERARRDRGLQAVVARGRTGAAGSRSTASGSISGMPTGPRGSTCSASTRQADPAGRSASTRLELSAPDGDGPRGAVGVLRSGDVDLHGHVNNAVHWQAVEDAARKVGSRSGGATRGRARTTAT